MTNTIIANSTSGGNCTDYGGGSITDGGHNIDDDGSCGLSGTSLSNTSPMLDPAGLKNNGGPTQTIALRAGSPAIDAGDESVCSAPPVNSLDQRGYLRPGIGATRCSIGAYEFNSPGSPCVGDCSNDSHVTVDEILTVVNIALGNMPIGSCQAGDANGDGQITVDEILAAVNDALNGCPVSDRVGPEGGQVQGPGGLVVTFPPGSVSSTVGVRIAPVSAQTLTSQITGTLQEGGLTFVLAFNLDTGGVTLQTPVQFSAPNAGDAPSGQALVLQVVASTSGTGEQAALSSAGPPAIVVDVAEITSDGIASGWPSFPGITTSGTFIVAAPGPGTTSLFGHGFVTDDAGVAVAKAVVQNLSSAFPSLSGNDGGYVVYLGPIDGLNLPVSATIVAQESVLSIGGALTQVLPWVPPIPGGGIVIIPLNGPIILVPGSKELADEIEEFCSQCSESIRTAIEATWENVLALQNVQATPIPFHGPLTVGVGDQRTFSSDPVPGPAPLKASLPSPESVACGNVDAKVIGLEFFFDLPTAVVLPTPPPPDPSIAAVVPAPTTQDLGNHQFQLHVTLQGVSPGTTTLIDGLCPAGSACTAGFFGDCLCIDTPTETPPPSAPCGNDQYPACDGLCPPGSTCTGALWGPFCACV